jgi:hypothetical protein
VSGGAEEEEQQAFSGGTFMEEESGTVSKHSGGADGTSQVQNDEGYSMRHEGAAAEKQRSELSCQQRQ